MEQFIGLQDAYDLFNSAKDQVEVLNSEIGEDFHQMDADYKTYSVGQGEDTRLESYMHIKVKNDLVIGLLNEVNELAEAIKTDEKGKGVYYEMLEWLRKEAPFTRSRSRYIDRQIAEYTSKMEWV